MDNQNKNVETNEEETFETITEETPEKLITEETTEKLITEETPEKLITEETTEKLITEETTEKLTTEETPEVTTNAQQGSYVYQENVMTLPKKKMGKKIVITVVIIAVVLIGIALVMLYVLPNAGIKANTMNLKGYEYQTLKGFSKSDKKAVDYEKNVDAENGENYLYYVYSLDDYGDEEINAYIESFIQGENLYITENGEYVAYFFENNDVLEFYFRQVENNIVVNWSVYDYVEENFAWMDEVGEAG